MTHHIAICIPCYNESANIAALYQRLTAALDHHRDIDFSIVFADNCSTDNAVELIEALAAKDSRIGLIRNVTNFGFVRSSAKEPLGNEP